MSGRQYFSYIQDENNNIYKKYRNEGEGRDGSTTLITIESWVGTTNLVFYSSYNASTLSRKLQKRSLACRECGTLQTRYPPKSLACREFYSLQTRCPL